MKKSSPFSSIPMNSGKKVLIFGYGNPGRQDDGLGIEFAERIGNTELKDKFTIETNYQLNIEDALLISDYDVVLFADASKEDHANEPYRIRELVPSEHFGISSHSMSPSTVLSFCQNLYQKFPKCYLMTIPGYQWELQNGLSEQAELNLEASLRDFSERFTTGHA